MLDKNIQLAPPGYSFVGIMTRPEVKKLPDQEYHCHVPAFDKAGIEMSPYHVAVYKKDHSLQEQFEKFSRGIGFREYQSKKHTKKRPKNTPKKERLRTRS